MHLSCSPPRHAIGRSHRWSPVSLRSSRWWRANHGVQGRPLPGAPVGQEGQAAGRTLTASSTFFPEAIENVTGAVVAGAPVSRHLRPSLTSVLHPFGLGLGDGLPELRCMRRWLFGSVGSRAPSLLRGPLLEFRFASAATTPSTLGILALPHLARTGAGALGEGGKAPAVHPFPREIVRACEASHPPAHAPPRLARVPVLRNPDFTCYSSFATTSVILRLSILFGGRTIAATTIHASAILDSGHHGPATEAAQDGHCRQQISR